MNLVGPGDLERHYVDADTALAVLDGAPPAGRWADLGTGAGFPGIVFAARYPELALDLVDSRQKRCAFLEHVLREAQIDPERVRVRCERIEALQPGAYDGVMARALAAPSVVLAHAARVLRSGGRALLLTGDEGAAAPGFHEVAALRYVLGERVRWARLLERTEPG
jgi:16S rRNA (guanine527-N7)-methyltransferase